MPLLIIIALIALALLVRRSSRDERLPGPIVAALLMTALAILTANFWLVNMAALVTLIWILSVLSGPRESRARRGHQRENERLGTQRGACLDNTCLDKRSAQRRDTRPAAGRVVPGQADDALSKSIEELLSRTAADLPVEAVIAVREFQRVVEETGAYLNSRALEDGEYARLLHQAVRQYLPDTVNAYLRLPGAATDAVVLEGGQTGRELLMGQLTMLQEAVRGVLEDAARSESLSLLAHQRFLEQRLQRRPRDFEL
ncbi:hypothetical protein [Deinococcus peraridilitoris]|uniref:5-bromo-4-chloroindolyl phosphate hydrolysis protein n=1 Tax=Deinococcus peraridilitoris (strain DSM 19664 / LMG 22246 / CIP 109416 / KR-200) TaxID=937777 RepID=L0A6K3_DEIPD|nr:hypothetical protein [Deinococcus peraridilitoris]AFZ69074.1 hypothetical protein Deipe_3648 [Deinococcus peraridilitoris DSM 19664]